VSPKRETPLPLPVRFLAAWIGVWLGRYQQQLIEYQREEIQLLRQKLGGRRLRFSDGDRRRLAVLGKKRGRRALGQVATVATPDTILRWYRELVAKKYDGRAIGGRGDRAPLPKSSACWCGWRGRTRVGVTRDCVERSRT